MEVCLVERQESRIRCAPDLGIAYLTGICKERAFDVSLVQSSPRTLYDSLVRDVDSIFPVFYKDKKYSTIIEENGESWFKEFLAKAYDLITSNEITNKVNPEVLVELWGLTSFLKEKVWSAFLSEDFGFKNRLYQEIEKSSPDVVGFSFWNFYDHSPIYNSLKILIDDIRENLGVPIVIGGPGTVNKRTRADIFKVFQPDYVVHHEGELAFVELLDMLEGGEIKKIPNLSYIENKKIVDGNSKPIDTPDILPLPDFSLYDLDSFFLPVRVLPMMTARGCEWGLCAFCDHHATYPAYNEFSVDRVLGTIEHYKERYKTDLIMFHDETLSARRARVLTEAFSKQDWDNTFFYSYAYPRGYDYRLLHKMYEVGFRTLVWGVESGCQEILNSMQKGTNVEEIEKILRASYKTGITNVCFIFFGFPGETPENARETVDFLSRNSTCIERHSVGLFYLTDDSPIGKNPERWGLECTSSGGYKIKEGMQEKESKEFLKKIGKLVSKGELKTSADTMYYMPGDTEFRAYFFMQCAYGETSEPDFSDGALVPVGNGLLEGNKLRPSFFPLDSPRRELQLNDKTLDIYKKCDGRNDITKLIGEFKDKNLVKKTLSDLLNESYLVFFKRKFLRCDQ